jgi:hypothetical protein
MGWFEYFNFFYHSTTCSPQSGDSRNAQIKALKFYRFLLVFRTVLVLIGQLNDKNIGKKVKGVIW